MSVSLKLVGLSRHRMASTITSRARTPSTAATVTQTGSRATITLRKCGDHGPSQ